MTAIFSLSAEINIDTTTNDSRIKYYYNLIQEQINNKNYNEVLNLADKLLAIIKKAKSNYNLDKIYFYRANSLMFLNLSDEALVDLHKALYFNKKFFKDSLQNLSNIYANIGYYNIQRFKHTDSVIIYYDKANKINEKYGDYYSITNNLYSLALTFLTNNTNVSHIDSLLKEALDYAKKTNQTDFFIKWYFHIINIYRHFKYYQNADELLTTKDYNKIIIESNDKETS